MRNSLQQGPQKRRTRMVESRFAPQNMRVPVTVAFLMLFARICTAEAATMAFKVHDAIRGNWAGQGVFYPGTITAVAADGTYSIAYRDGDRETHVPIARIESLSAPSVDKVASGVATTTVPAPAVIITTTTASPSSMH